MCPITKGKCPKNDDCDFWLVPGELPLINAKSSDKFPARGMCLCHMAIVMLWDANVNIIGTQQATESFRNNMTETVNGKGRPKLDLASAMLLKIMSKQGELLIDRDNIKQITDINGG
jgi:hypothetical protein